MNGTGRPDDAGHASRSPQSSATDARLYPHAASASIEPMELRRGLEVLCDRKISHMDLKDATLMIVKESAHPAWPDRAAAYDQLVSGQEVDYRVLDDMVGEASGKGVLRAIRQKYGADRPRGHIRVQFFVNGPARSPSRHAGG